MARHGVRVTVAVAVGSLALIGCGGPPGQAPARPVTSPSVTATASSSPPAARTLTILGAGDVLLHRPVSDQAAADGRAAGRGGFDYAQIFAGVQPAIAAADLAVCHLETPLAAAGGPFQGYPTFSVPPAIVTTLAAVGYDTCSTASNHTLDQGTAGVYRTLDALDAAGLSHAGSYRSATAHATPTLIPVAPHGGGAPVLVAHLSYTYWFNGLKRPPGKAWIANQIDPSAILAEAHRARKAGAAIVVVSLHWGVEYDHDASVDQQRLARQLLASPDIDLILGCHAHVVQPMEKINGKWVSYGMGNQVAKHGKGTNATREGIMPAITFAERAPGAWIATAAEVIPTWVQLSPKVRIVDLGRALADPATKAADRAIYAAAVRRIRGYVSANGTTAAGLTVRAPTLS
jgi:poly-gamma-glutamate synthesis protein (capsule biosynthesis protein)